MSSAGPNLHSRHLIYFFTESKPVHSLAFDPVNENCLLVGTAEGEVSTWNLKTNRREDNAVIKSGSKLCMSMCFCKGELFTQDKTGLVRCWGKNKHNWVEVRNISSDYFGFCKIDTCANLISCPWKEAVIKVYNNNLEEVASFNPENETLGSVNVCKLVSLDGDLYTFNGYENSELMLWSAKSCEVVSKLTLKHGVPLALDFDEDDRKGVIGFTSKKFVIFKVDVFLNISKIQTLKLSSAGVNCVKIQKTAGLFAIGCWDAKIRIFSWSNYEPLSVLSFHSGSIEDIAFSKERFDDLCEEGYMLAAGSVDCKISLWIVPDHVDHSSEN